VCSFVRANARVHERAGLNLIKGVASAHWVSEMYQYVTFVSQGINAVSDWEE
jgi:hypothetical protein